jgi:hypothetical protein
MITPTQLNALISKDIDIIISLSKNVTEEMLAYKPKENMRSMQELMSYLTGCGYNFQSYWMTDGSKTTQEFFTELRATLPLVTLDNFEERMLLEKENISKLIHSLSIEEFNTKMVKYPWGAEAPIGMAMIETSVKWLTAYKYQFLMYIKMCSDVELGTKDVWVEQV